MTHTTIDRPALAPIHEVDVGDRSIRAGVFAIPLLIPDGAQTEEAEVMNIDGIAKLLHGPGEFGTEVQGFCLFPWIVRPSLVTALIPDRVQEQVAQALVQDALLAAQGGASRMEIGLAGSLHKKCGLGYLLGVVMVDDEHGIDPELPQHTWDTGVGQAFEAMLSSSATDDIVSTGVRIRALQPAWIEDALMSGLLEAADQALGGPRPESAEVSVHVLNVRDGVAEVRLAGADAVTAIHLQRDLVGDAFVHRLCRHIDDRFCGGSLSRMRAGRWLN